MTCVTFFTLTRSCLSVTDGKMGVLKLNPSVSLSFNRSTMLLRVKFWVGICYRYL
jgi:hypothetical protein